MPSSRGSWHPRHLLCSWLLRNKPALQAVLPACHLPSVITSQAPDHQNPVPSLTLLFLVLYDFWALLYNVTEDSVALPVLFPAQLRVHTVGGCFMVNGCVGKAERFCLLVYWEFSRLKKKKRHEKCRQEGYTWGISEAMEVKGRTPYPSGRGWASNRGSYRGGVLGKWCH